MADRQGIEADPAEQDGHALSAWADSDRSENEATRLPDGEELHLGGLVLAEAFTPSTISALYEALESFPAPRENKDEWIARLSKGRSAEGLYGWQSLGIVRRHWVIALERHIDIGMIGGGVHIDPTLPDGVDAVVPYLFFPVPSLTLIIATFTLTDEAGDLSDLLRADYHAKVVRHIRWTSPGQQREELSVRGALHQKRLACESLVTMREATCSTWLARRFPGRFSVEQPANRPAVRLLLTKDTAPFEDSAGWLAPAGLLFGPDVWRSADPLGWFLKFGGGTGDRRFTATAARRRDASPGQDVSGDTIQYLTEQFASGQRSLVARWAMTCLLSLYANRLAELRDRAGKQHPLKRPIQQGRDLDSYLLGDGLDASTIVSDLGDLTGSLADFRLGVPDYSEYLDPFPAAARVRNQPRELVSSLREQLRAQAERLSQDTAVTTGNIRASAELRQAIANTRMQRVVVFLSFLAVVIAIISLVVAFGAA